MRRRHMYSGVKHRLARSARYNALVTLRSTIVTKTGSSYRNAIQPGLQLWLEGQDEPNISQDSIPIMDLQETIQAAILEQQDIGWNFAFWGYLSNKWCKAQQMKHSQSTLMGIKTLWGKEIIHALWQFSGTLWEASNKQVHNPTNSAHDTNPLDATIQRLYAIQDTFAASDRVLFDLPLIGRLRTPRKSRQHWVKLVAWCHQSTSVQQKGNQSHAHDQLFYSQEKVRLSRLKLTPNSHHWTIRQTSQSSNKQEKPAAILVTYPPSPSPQMLQWEVVDYFLVPTPR